MAQDPALIEGGGMDQHVFGDAALLSEMPPSFHTRRKYTI
jgi:hypothetical protein